MAALGFIARLCGSIVCAGTLAATPTESVPVSEGVPRIMAAAMATAPAPRSDTRLSVLTYNVHGLPEFLRKSDVGPLDAISDRLRTLRRLGRQPHVVLLQEAFTDEAKRIGTASGYRYIANGPAAGQNAPLRAYADWTEIEAEKQWWAGEGLGKYVDSGLQVLSDYPILEIRRLPFPDHACAGFDCLANKGMLLVSVGVPGLPEPVDIATTHLNSRGSAGVARSRSLVAYRRQVEELFGFLEARRHPQRPLIFAGDLNIGSARARRAAFFGGLRGAAPELPLQDAISSVATHHPAGMPDAAIEVQQRAKDWQFWSNGSETALEPVAIDVSFGHEPDGTMLSDHIGFAAEYRIVAPARRRGS